MKLAPFDADGLVHRPDPRGLPRFLTYHVTNRRYVDPLASCIRPLPSTGELTLPEVERIFGELPRLDVVRLSGGEPFARPDLGAIARLTEDYLEPMVLQIVTDGLLTDRIVRFCEGRRKMVPLRLVFCLEDPKQGQASRQVRTARFDSTAATIAALAPRQQELCLRLSVKLGGDDSARTAGAFDTFGDLTAEGIEAWGRLVEVCAESHASGDASARRRHWEGVKGRLAEHRRRFRSSSEASALHLRILPNGDVPSRQAPAGMAGNLRRESFLRVWFRRSFDDSCDGMTPSRGGNIGYRWENCGVEVAES